MDALATVDGLLRGVGSQLGVTLSLDEDGRCALDCGPGLTVVVAVPEGAELLLFYAPLLPAPVAGREALFERCLALNLHGAGTDGCTLGHDDVSGEIVLSLVLPLSLVQPDLFGTLLGNFIRTARRLRTELAQAGDGAAAEAPPASRPELPASVADMLLNVQWRA